MTADSTAAARPPEWELDMIVELVRRWDVTPEEAEEYLEEIGAFGSRKDWLTDEQSTDSTAGADLTNNEEVR